VNQFSHSSHDRGYFSIYVAIRGYKHSYMSHVTMYVTIVVHIQVFVTIVVHIQVFMTTRLRDYCAQNDHVATFMVRSNKPYCKLI
jgi:hypothetical protein